MLQMLGDTERSMTGQEKAREVGQNADARRSGRNHDAKCLLLTWKSR